MRYDFAFITVGLFCLIVGETFGIWMGSTNDFTFAPAHAHLNLVGWVTLCLYGLAHRAYPSLAASPLARIQAWLAIPSALILPAGIAYAIATQNPIIAIIGSVGVLLGTVLFAVLFTSRARAA